MASTLLHQPSPIQFHEMVSRLSSFVALALFSETFHTAFPVGNGKHDEQDWLGETMGRPSDISDVKREVNQVRVKFLMYHVHTRKISQCLHHRGVTLGNFDTALQCAKELKTKPLIESVRRAGNPPDLLL